jgi:hypothetical protein
MDYGCPSTLIYPHPSYTRGKLFQTLGRLSTCENITRLGLYEVREDDSRTFSRLTPHSAGLTTPGRSELHVDPLDRPAR